MIIDSFQNKILQMRLQYLLRGKNSEGNQFYDYDKIISRAVSFAENLKITKYEYRYSTSCSKPTIYSSAYACMLLSLSGRLKDQSNIDKDHWIDYFNSFQNEKDGLFYDPVLDSKVFRNTDCWGARHLALHLITVFTVLGGKPKYPFRFLEKYYDGRFIHEWFTDNNWNGFFPDNNDIDNKIMNVGCLLQYQRDVWNDAKAEASVKMIQESVYEKINHQTGMWGCFDIDNKAELSRMTQFAYHLLSIFFYDGLHSNISEKIVDYALLTQNERGGFGAKPNTSACEDIDSVDILVRMAPFVPSKAPDIDRSLRRAESWILSNQVQDGGFVFRLFEPFTYGHPQMYSGVNKGSLFATWFRILCLAYIERHFKRNTFTINSCPGLEY